MKIETKMKIMSSAALVAVLLISGCKSGGGGQQGGGAGGGMPPLPIESAAVTRQTITDNFTAVGTVEAINAVQIVSEISGKITALPFKEGETISKGSLIAQLDDSQLKASRDRAQALLEQRQTAFDRFKGMVESGAVTKQEFDDASSTLKVAEADLALAKANLAKTAITAPFTGTIGAKQVSVGEFVQPLANQPIAELAQLDELKVTFSAPERFYPLLHKGAAITVSSPAFKETLTGEIDIIEPMVDQGTRSVTITAHLKNPEGLFHPGMSANVNAILNQRDSALLIPSQAIIVEGNQMSVYIINPDSTVAKTTVQLGSRTAGLVEITSGLSEGQQVVIAGYQKFGFLPPGFKVMSLPPPGAAGQAPAGTQSAPAAHDSAAMPSDSADTVTGGK